VAYAENCGGIADVIARVTPVFSRIQAISASRPIRHA
jgi:hypothetical protein